MAQHIPDEILFDVRLVERHITRGLITRDQWEKYRAQSTDVTENSESFDVEQPNAGAQRAAPKRPQA
jgi:hypothetical protein